MADITILKDSNYHIVLTHIHTHMVNLRNIHLSWLHLSSSTLSISILLCSSTLLKKYHIARQNYTLCHIIHAKLHTYTSPILRTTHAQYYTVDHQHHVQNCTPTKFLLSITKFLVTPNDHIKNFKLTFDCLKLVGDVV